MDNQFQFGTYGYIAKKNLKSRGMLWKIRG